MTGHYFELLDDIHIPGRWELKDPVDAQGRELKSVTLRRGEPVHVEMKLQIPLHTPGKALDFSLPLLAPVPIVHSRVVALFSELAPRDVQLLPVQIEGQSDPYFLVNVTRVVKCIDDENSDEVRYWKPEHGQPAKVGGYRSVIGLRIDPTQVGDAQIFRTWGWLAIVVSQAIKEALENLGATGPLFTLATGPSDISPEERAFSRRCRELLESADAARKAAWRTLGQLDEDVTLPMGMNKAWPGHRQIWRAIRRPSGNTLLVTHGFSDPFIDTLESSVGFGLELLLEVDASVKDISKGWPLLLLERVADEIAEHEPLRKAAKVGLLCLEVPGQGLPKSLITPEGRVAVLLGVGSHTLPGSFSSSSGEVRLVTVKLLLPSERAYLREHGAQGTALLAQRFAASGEEHVSRLKRLSRV